MACIGGARNSFCGAMKLSLCWSLCFLLGTAAIGRAADPYAEANAVQSASDKELNVAYQHLIEQIKKDQPERADQIIAQLRLAQRAWLKFADEQTVFIGTYSDIGSATARAAGLATYRAELVRQRIAELKDVPDPF